MSLSPRPERLRMTRSSLFNRGRRSIRPGMGGEVSGAGVGAAADVQSGTEGTMAALESAHAIAGLIERGNDAFCAREEARGVESGLIGDGGVFGAALIGEPGVLGADGGIVEAGGNGMRRGDLAVFVLQNVSVSALEDTGACSPKSLVRGAA